MRHPRIIATDPTLENIFYFAVCNPVMVKKSFVCFEFSAFISNGLRVYLTNYFPCICQSVAVLQVSEKTAEFHNPRFSFIDDDSIVFCNFVYPIKQDQKFISRSCNRSEVVRITRIILIPANDFHIIIYPVGKDEADILANLIAYINTFAEIFLSSKQLFIYAVV